MKSLYLILCKSCFRHIKTVKYLKWKIFCPKKENRAPGASSWMKLVKELNRILWFNSCKTEKRGTL